MTSLLEVYDAECRAEAEVKGAFALIEAIGPGFLGVREGRGFYTYRSLGGRTGDDVDALIEQVLSRVVELGCTRMEWKVRGHDQPGDLAIRLMIKGFTPEIDAGIETVMMGTVEPLAARRQASITLADGRDVHLRRITYVPTTDAAAHAAMVRDSERCRTMQSRVFGDKRSMSDLATQWEGWGNTVAFVYAECDGEPVCAGTVTMPENSQVAGLWGGATVPAFRGNGLYVAVAAERAAIAAERGFRYMMSDALPTSRPILERCGLQAITTTTPMMWTAPA